MNKIADFIKTKRKEAGLTQEEFAMRSGLGLRFIRELEQGKETVRMDKVNQALAMFGMTAIPGKEGAGTEYPNFSKNIPAIQGNEDER
jgi:y4mF family transcriptional regulator